MSDAASKISPELELLADASRIHRERLLKDPHRPGYHFIVPEGVNAPVDPNGALYWNGRYHLCYIYQSAGRHFWGHISSSDLVHWRQHPTALAPGEGDEGIFSGGAFIDANGTPTISYWGLGKPRGICLATSTDENLDVWTKSPANPVIKETSHGLAVLPSSDGKGETVYGAADPSSPWRHNGRNYMLTGNLLVQIEYGRKKGMAEHLGDTAYLFVSDDLVNWRYLHEFYKSDRKWTAADEDNMCPEFFPLPSSPEGGEDSGRHMMLCISHNKGCRYYIGRYENDKFIPESHERMTWVDNCFFAPECVVDPKGRRIMWSWVMDQRESGRRFASGWSGELSLPRVLWLGEDKTLRMKPADELKALRYNHRTIAGMKIAGGSACEIPSLSGNSIELDLLLAPGSAKRTGLKICRSPEGEEETAIYYDSEKRTLNIDVRKASLVDGIGTRSVESAPFELKGGERLQLRVFIDKSIVEVFANERQAVVRRLYPSRPDSVGTGLYAEGGDAELLKGDAWTMMPSNAY